MSIRYPVVVIGAGQAGVVIGRQLRLQGIDFLMLDGGSRVGHAWRNRWDSLRLFTAAEFSGLPGLAFPGDPDVRPTKDQLADYLEEYARRWRLPIRCNTRVTSLTHENGQFIIKAGDARFEAEQVVIATGPYQTAITPSWAGELDAAITRLHSSAYRNAGQLAKGGVLVVGAGNTGAELALESAAAGHEVWLSGRDVGEVPPFFRLANGRIFWFLATRVFTTGNPIGRAFKRSMRAHHGAPLVRIRSKEITAAGIRRVGRVTAVVEGRPQLQDGRILDVQTVILCTGYRTDFGWIDLPIFEADGYPRHERGRVPSHPGLYFIGLPFQHSLASSTLVGVQRDAAVVTKWIVEGLGQRQTLPSLAMRMRRA